MKCPVCKTECSEQQSCAECGFNEVNNNFVNSADAKDWFEKIVLPYRMSYWAKKYPFLKIEENAIVGTTGLRGSRSKRQKVTKLIVPHGIEKVAEGVFSHGELEIVQFPTTLRYVGEYAFLDCPIKSVYLPASIEHIGDSCFSAKEIVLDEANQNYRIENNCLIENNTGKLLFCTNRNVTKIVIPEGVSIIGVYAFSDCDKIAEIIMPSSLTHIMRGAFLRCKSLRTLLFKNKLQKVERYVFEQCHSLDDIYFDVTEDEVELDPQWKDACFGVARVHWKGSWFLVNDTPLSFDF